MMGAYYTGLDIGGTHIKYGTVSDAGTIYGEGSRSSESNAGPTQLYETVCEVIDGLIGARGELPKAIGLGLTGGVDPDRGTVLLPGKFRGLEGFPIVPKLRERYKLPVWADNDGRLAAYAERYFGKAKDVDWAVVLTIGTGVGSGVITNGEILIDPYLLFGTQIGHGIINKTDDRICLTGNQGTGEVLCSATALALQVRSAIQRGILCTLTDRYWDNPHSVDFEAVIQACREDDPLCLRELDIWVNNLALLLINAVHYYAPQRIILAGGATNGADLFLNKLNRLVNQQLFRYPANREVELCVSSMKSYAGVLGAAAMVKEKYERRTNHDRMD